MKGYHNPFSVSNEIMDLGNLDAKSLGEIFGYSIMGGSGWFPLNH